MYVFVFQSAVTMCRRRTGVAEGEGPLKGARRGAELQPRNSQSWGDQQTPSTCLHYVHLLSHYFISLTPYPGDKRYNDTHSTKINQYLVIDFVKHWFKITKADNTF